MPLSEHEQRVLEQIERSLYADDPKFAATVRGIDPRSRQRRRYLRAGLALLAGAALICVGLIVGPPELVAVGTVVAITAAGYTISCWQHGPHRGANAANGAKGANGAAARQRQGFARRRGDAPQPKHTIMQRFEDRWNRRREGLGN